MKPSEQAAYRRGVEDTLALAERIAGAMLAVLMAPLRKELAASALTEFASAVRETMTAQVSEPSHCVDTQTEPVRATRDD